MDIHPAMSTYLLFELQNVSYRYDEKIPALSEITLSIREGERVAIMGPIGSGKTSLLKILRGDLTAGSGKMRFFGEIFTPEKITVLQAKTGFLRQNPDEQLFRPTVFDDLLYGIGVTGPLHKDRAAKIDDICHIFGIQDLLDRSSTRISGGEKRMVRIASVLASCPEIVILDEPVAGLNGCLKHQILELLKNSPFAPRTLILATNDTTLAGELCDRIVLLSPDHRMVADGPARKILKDPDLLMVAQMLPEQIHPRNGFISLSPLPGKTIQLKTDAGKT